MGTIASPGTREYHSPRIMLGEGESSYVVGALFLPRPCRDFFFGLYLVYILAIAVNQAERARSSRGLRPHRVAILAAGGGLSQFLSWSACRIDLCRR